MNDLHRRLRESLLKLHESELNSLDSKFQEEKVYKELPEDNTEGFKRKGTIEEAIVSLMIKHCSGKDVTTKQILAILRVTDRKLWYRLKRNKSLGACLNCLYKKGMIAKVQTDGINYWQVV